MNVTKEFVKQNGFLINNIAHNRFSEDDIMRYHYLSYSYADSTLHSGVEYDATSIFVFYSFLKKTWIYLRKR